MEQQQFIQQWQCWVKREATDGIATRLDYQHPVIIAASKNYLKVVDSVTRNNLSGRRERPVCVS